MPCVPSVEKVHRVHRQHDGEVELRLTFSLDETQPQLTTSTDDITKHLVDGELILTREKRDLFANLPPISA
jgi:hypothetical protein